jgi:tetratricopeptide (TPR) repeat protein
MNERKNDIGADERELLEQFGTTFEAVHARHADCPKPELLLASETGVLDKDAAKNIAAHIGKCNFCQVLLRDLKDAELDAARPEEGQRVRERVLSATTGSAKAEKAGGGVLLVWLRRAVPVAAVAGIILAAVVWVRFRQTTGPLSIPTPVAVQPSKPAVPSVLQWEKLPIKLQASSVLVLRGKPRTGQEKYAADLTTALAFYRDDKFGEAAEKLTRVAQAFPDGVEAQLYLGISRMSLQQNAQAIPSLTKAQQLGPEAFREDATWYLALAQNGSGNRQQSITELGKLCQGKSTYSQRACAGIRELSVLPGDKP